MLKFSMQIPKINIRKNLNNEQWLKRDPKVIGKYKQHLIKIQDDNVEKSKP